MSFFNSGFDAAKVEPAAPFAPIPEGEYKVLVKSAAEKQTKKVGGIGLSLEYKVIDDGPAKGRTLFHWINLRNANPQAAEIGQRELASLCRATQIMRPTSAAQFANKTIRVKVEVEKDQEGKMRNRIAGIVLPEAAPAVAPTPAPVAAGAPVAAEGAPWG